MKYLKLLIFAAVFLLGTAETGSAYTWFSDDFNSYNSGNNSLNFYFNDPDQRWSVTSGTIDLIGNGSDDIITGHGLYIDINSSSGITSRGTNLSDGYYMLSFDLAGNGQESSSAQLTVMIETYDLFTESYPVDYDSQFQTFTKFFKIEDDDDNYPSVTINFLTADGANSGILLDNVMLESVSPVPLPGAIWLLGSGIIAVIGYRKKFKK